MTAGTGPSNSVSIDPVTNRLTGTPYAYDANGNMTNDGLNILAYDAENHAVSSTGSLGSGTYTYDGNGLRVKKVSGATTTVYIFSGSKVIAEYVNGAAPASPTREYLYSGATLLAKIESGATKYYHQDHLSNRVVTDSTGTVTAQLGHFPFGESWYNASNDKLLFTSYERDSESGNDYAMARYSINRLGRFSSPDPLVGSIADPQSLNRYAYVRNSPVNLTDPTGLCIAALLDENGNVHACYDSMLWGRSGGSPWGLPSEIAEEEARHNSIITTGYDPAFGIYRGNVEVYSCRNGICFLDILKRPTLAQANELLTAAILWASGPAGFAQGQFPQAAAAGAGGASVAVTWIGGGGAVIGGGTVLVVGGAIVATAAVAYLGYRAYIYLSEQSQIKDAAKAAGITYQQFSEYLHAIKGGPGGGGRGPGDNYTYAQLVALAKEAAQWYASHK